VNETPKVTHGFVSFTEVEAGHHRSYNQWHLFDHMPEQFPLPGIVFGQRWVLTPALRAFMKAETPLDRVHYVTLYLLGEPIEATLRDFRDLAVALREKNRFHEHRTAHAFGPMAVRACVAAPRALVAAEALPYRPNRGVHVRLAATTDAPADAPATAGVAGAWTFTGTALSPPDLQDATLTVQWLDDAPASVAPTLSAEGASFDATLAAIDPWAAWDWFD
jgi:hypothetical protein